MARCMKCGAELYVRPTCLICGWEATVPVHRTLPDVSNLAWVAWGRIRVRGPRPDSESSRQGIPAWSLRLTATEATVQSRRADVVDLKS